MKMINLISYFQNLKRFMVIGIKIFYENENDKIIFGKCIYDIYLYGKKILLQMKIIIIHICI